MRLVGLAIVATGIGIVRAKKENSSERFKGQYVLVLGGTGVVGTGIVRQFATEGASVIVPYRTQDKLTALRKAVGEDCWEHIISIKGDLNDEQSATTLKDNVLRAIHPGKHGKLNHVVASIGGLTEFSKKPTETLVEEVTKLCWDEGFIPHFLAATNFLPLLKDVEGSSYTVVNGLLREVVPGKLSYWPSCVKDAALHGLFLALAKEFEEKKVRVNELVIRVYVIPEEQTGGTGTPRKYSSARVARIFTNIAAGSEKGEVQVNHQMMKSSEQKGSVTQGTADTRDTVIQGIPPRDTDTVEGIPPRTDTVEGIPLRDTDTLEPSQGSEQKGSPDKRKQGTKRSLD